MSILSINYHAERVLNELLGDLDLRRATSYLSPTMVAKATRQRRKDRRYPNETFLVTIGKPNYRERKFIKAAQKAGEPFPVRKVQITEWPKKKTKDKKRKRR